MDEFSTGAARIHRHMPVNLAERLRGYGRNCGVLRIMGVSRPEADLRARISRKKQQAPAKQEHRYERS